MTQQRDYKMQPIAWRDTPLADVFAAYDLLPNQCHHDSMIHVMVRSITVGNIFHCQSRDEADDAGITRLEHPIDLLILLLELLNKRVGNDLCGLNIAVSIQANALRAAEVSAGLETNNRHSRYRRDKNRVGT
jgi:hypothetical protein